MAAPCDGRRGLGTFSTLGAMPRLDLLLPVVETSAGPAGSNAGTSGIPGGVLVGARRHPGDRGVRVGEHGPDPVLLFGRGGSDEARRRGIQVFSQFAETAAAEGDRHDPGSGSEDLPFPQPPDRDVGGDRGERRGREASSQTGRDVLVGSRTLCSIGFSMESDLSRCLPPNRHGFEARSFAEIDVQLPERLVVRFGLRDIDVARRKKHALIGRRLRGGAVRGSHLFDCRQASPVPVAPCGGLGGGACHRGRLGVRGGAPRAPRCLRRAGAPRRVPFGAIDVSDPAGRLIQQRNNRPRTTL